MRKITELSQCIGSLSLNLRFKLNKMINSSLARYVPAKAPVTRYNRGSYTHFD